MRLPKEPKEVVIERMWRLIYFDNPDWKDYVRFKKCAEPELTEICCVCKIRNFKDWMIRDPDGYLGCKDCLKFQGEDITEEWNADITEIDLP